MPVITLMKKKLKRIQKTEIKVNEAQEINYSLFFPGRRVRAHLQNPATKCDFPIGYFIFLLTL
jgi:hypothetical protein